MSKERLTVTVDSELIEAANQAVTEGRVASLSGWVNLALAERAAKERRLRALAEAVAAYEDEFGEITVGCPGACRPAKSDYRSSKETTQEPMTVRTET